MSILNNKTKQFKKDFKDFSKDNNTFYTYLTAYMSATLLCFMMIFTKTIIVPIIVSSLFFALIRLGMRKIFNQLQTKYVIEEITKYKERLWYSLNVDKKIKSLTALFFWELPPRKLQVNFLKHSATNKIGRYSA